MNKIEKMYKTIFGEFAPTCRLCAKLVDCKIFNNTHNCNKFECDYKGLFTAKRQLELLKMFIDTEHCIEEFFRCTNSRAYCLSTSNVRNLSENTFEELIAEVIIRHWDLFVPEEKEKIRGILDGQ